MADVEETPIEETPVEDPEVEADVEVEQEEEFVAVGSAHEVKLFGKWSFDDIEIRDISLEVRCSVMIFKFIDPSRWKTNADCVF